MNQISKFLFLLAFTATLFTSCTSDDDTTMPSSEPLGAYDNGYFILNQGGSSPSTSGVDFISDSGVKTEDIFRIENPDQEEIGSFLESIFFDETRAFIVDGLTNSVTVVNRYTFKHIVTLSSNFDNPRNGVVIDDKAYVTNRTDFSVDTDDYITIIDLVDYSTTILELDVITEKIVKSGNKLVVSNGGFNSGTTITIIDTNNSNAINTLDLGEENFPNSIVNIGNTTYALTGTKKFVEINVATETITSTLDLPTSISGSTKSLKMVDDEVYFISGSSVYNFELGDSSISETPIFTYSGGIYGFEVTENKIYIGDAGDFASPGNAYEYSLDGTLLASFTTSTFSPAGFFFN